MASFHCDWICLLRPVATEYQRQNEADYRQDDDQRQYRCQHRESEACRYGYGQRHHERGERTGDNLLEHRHAGRFESASLLARECAAEPAFQSVRSSA